ncbi:MAG: MFS transporter, partial [Mesorhizobium sp.]
MTEPTTGVIDAAVLDSADSQERSEPAWGAVVSLALGVFGLVTAEFLPASLLTRLAQD